MSFFLQIVFFSGMVINEVVNFLLKHTICEARPMRRDVLYSEYGMPSSHAQFMWFFTAYMVLFVCIRYISNCTMYMLYKKYSVEYCRNMY